MAGSSRRRWVALATLSVGVAMIIVDATIVNVAIPQIIRDLGISLADAEWITTVYALVFAALLITVGRIGDLRGRKRLFLSGLVVFVVASMLAGLAPSGGALIGARVLQGVGAAMILPSTLSTVNATFQGRDRAIAFGIWGSVIGGMAALGPLLGGWLTTTFSWRWAFYINLPIGAVAFAAAIVLVEETRDPSQAAGFDVPGFALSALGLVSLLFGLIEGPRLGWWSPTGPFEVGPWAWPLESLSPAPVALGVGAVCLIGFFAVEARRRGRDRPVLFDLELFRLPSFRWGNLTALVLSLGEFGLVFVLPLFLQAVLSYTAFQTGLLLAALALGAFIGGPGAAAVAQRIGAHRVVTIGMGIEVGAILWIALLFSPGLTGGALVLPLFIYGIGVGLATAQLTSTILVEVPPAKSGQGSGMQSTFRQVGSALGIALLGTVLAGSLGRLTAAELEQVPGLPPEAVAGISEAVAGSAGQALPAIAEQPGSEPVVAAVSSAFAESARRSVLVADAFVLCGFGISLLLPDPRRLAQAPHTDTEEDIGLDL